MTCPDDPAQCKAWHCRVRDDAMSGEPETDHGKALLQSARWFSAANAMMGECLCGSSLFFTLKS